VIWKITEIPYFLKLNNNPHNELSFKKIFNNFSLPSSRQQYRVQYQNIQLFLKRAKNKKWRKKWRSQMTKSVSNLFSILPLARKLLALSTFKLIIQLCVCGLNSDIIVNYKSVI